MFISFEGIDGSGKTVQMQLLEGALLEAGYQVVKVREPGGTPLSEAVRDILLNHKGDVAPLTEMLLFSAARHQLVKEVIQPALAAGKIVLADRFFDSTLAYQGSGRALMELGKLKAFQLQVTEGLKPDRTYYLDVNLEESLKRRKGEKNDRIENADSDFFDRVNSYYRSLSLLEQERVVHLDASESIQDLHHQIMDDVLAVLPPIEKNPTTP